MKSVLASFNPQQCELIVSGKKTVEIRKTRPKLESPFKVYMYQTKSRWVYKILKWLKLYQGKVIGEFICDKITRFRVFEDGAVQYWNFADLENSCLTYDQIVEYIGRNKFGYAGHIYDLVIYDKPKELSEFYRKCNGIHCRGNDCEHWKYMRVNTDEFEMDCDCNEFPPITRPPQSWCYVEELR